MEKLYLPEKDARVIIGKPVYDTLYIHAEKLVIKDKELEITINWQQLKAIKKLVFWVKNEKLVFQREK